MNCANLDAGMSTSQEETNAIVVERVRDSHTRARILARYIIQMCCATAKPVESGHVKLTGGHEIGKNAAEKSGGLFSADDWQCKGSVVQLQL